MIKFVNVVSAAILVAGCAGVTMAQNFNTSNAATVSSNPFLMVVGAIALVAIGLVVGFAIARRKKG